MNKPMKPCPKCGSRRLKVYAVACVVETVEVNHAGDDVEVLDYSMGDTEWEPTSRVECTAYPCDWHTTYAKWTE
jgi:hypothetical protein